MPGGYKGIQGAKPKPTRMKELAGTLKAHRVNPDEPEPPVLERTPPCPMHLTGEARKAWRRLSRQLKDMGVISAIDLDALEAYCVVFDRWREAEKELRKTGPVIVNPQTNWFEPSPYLRVVDNCLKQMRAYMTELGITPSSRSRVRAIKPKEETGDGIDKYLFGKN